MKVIEEKDSRVKVHYIGYSHSFDEWKERAEIEILEEEQESGAVATTCDRYTPFSSFDELHLKIKNGLSCSRMAPKIKINNAV